MAWEKGQSGNPGGKSGEKLFAYELRHILAVEDQATKQRRLRRIVEKLVECAEQGESWAILQVADRLDGKPAQESTVTIDDKRDATDWTRAELVALINEHRARGNGAAEANGRDHEPDSVH